jgi:hypothetical protein
VPERIQLRRTKGWTLPPDTVKVDRSTVYGNPFIVGQQGPAIACVYNYALMIHGFLCVAFGQRCFERQAKACAILKAQQPDFTKLKGKNLACWCAPDAPCHADILLFLVNHQEGEEFDMNAYMGKHGWKIEDGMPHRLS